MLPKDVSSQDEITRERIAQRAYSIWEREGRPLDRAFDHWLKAEAEVAASLTPPQPERRRAVKPRAHGHTA